MDLLLRNGWTYVKLLYSNSAYGNTLADHFFKLTSLEGICIATQLKIEDHLVRNEKAMKNIVKFYLLESFPTAEVVVMLTTDSDARAILKAADALVKDGLPWEQNLTWISTDYWGSNPSVVKGLEHVAKGAITLDFKHENLPNFMEYFKQITPYSDTVENPWFLEYWQSYFDCFIQSCYRKQYTKQCEFDLTLVNENIGMSSQAPLVIDAVYAMVFGFKKLLVEHCGVNFTGVCREAKNNLHRLHEVIRKLKLHVKESNREIMFDVLGNGKPQYDIYRFTESSKDRFRYGKVCFNHHIYLILDYIAIL